MDNRAAGPLLVLFAIVFFWIGYFGGRSDMRGQAVEHGFAEYDRQTGDWQWKGESDE